MKIAECRKKIQETTFFYTENNDEWAEFQIGKIPFRVNKESIIQSRTISTSRAGAKLGGWRNKPITKGKTDNYGGWYMSVGLNGCVIRVHQLMVVVFIGPIEMGMEINHIDSNRGNNKIENLEICTRLENAQHAVKNGSFEGNDLRGKINKKILMDICEMINKGVNNTIIGKILNLDRAIISKIRNGRIYTKHTNGIIEYKSILMKYK